MEIAGDITVACTKLFGQMTSYFLNSPIMGFLIIIGKFFYFLFRRSES